MKFFHSRYLGAGRTEQTNAMPAHDFKTKNRFLAIARHPIGNEARRLFGPAGSRAQRRCPRGFLRRGIRVRIGHGQRARSKRGGISGKLFIIIINIVINIFFLEYLVVYHRDANEPG